MNIRHALLAITVTLLSSCNPTGSYNLTVDAGDEYNGKEIIMISRNKLDTIGQATVNNGKAIFQDTITVPMLVQLVPLGSENPFAEAIIEPGDIQVTVEEGATIGLATGTPLNAILAEWIDARKQRNARVEAIDRNSDNAQQTMQEVFNEYKTWTDSLMQANIDNTIGASLFISRVYDLSIEALEDSLERHPILKTYNEITKQYLLKKNAAETVEGKPYKDFTINSVSLSSLMKPGRYTLIDFWASWCGPCRRAMPLLKELYGQYKDKGLEVLGVAVWDEPADSERAARQMQLPWPQIINAQKIPTDLYGIYGIPHLMLIAPDGTIATRGIEGDEMRKAIADAFTPAAPETATEQ